MTVREISRSFATIIRAASRPPQLNHAAEPNAEDPSTRWQETETPCGAAHSGLDDPDESRATCHGPSGSASMMHLCLAGYPGE
jgi:hypothetical protein